MTYPMQNLFQAEMEYERDFDRMKAMYPKEVTKILLCVQDRCDELEYEGSRMFDEEPDRLMMEKEIRNLYEKLRAEFEQSGEAPVLMEEESPQLQAFSLLPPEDWGLKEKPDVVITTGALVSYPFCLLEKARGGKVIYIESFARVTEPSLTGKLVHKHADLFLVQWEDMLDYFPDAVLGGGIF